MSLEVFGDDGGITDPCEGCIALEDLVEAVKKIARAPVYEDREKAKGISVELVGAILDASRIADDL